MNGILKYKSEDFIVTEIDEDGNLIKFNDLFSINEINTLFQTIQEEVDKVILSDDRPKTLTDAFLGECTALLEMNERKRKINGVEKTVEFEQSNLSKEERGNIHKYIRFRFHGQLSSSYSENKFVIKKFSRKNDDRSTGSYFLHFALKKDNYDSMKAIDILSYRLGLRNASSFAYCGTKDRRGITVQKCSLHFSKISNMRDRLIKFMGQMTEKSQLKIGNFSIEKYPLKLGNLAGNRFSILLRNVKLNDENLKKFSERIEELEKFKYFINFFGDQRFGVFADELSTWKIGLYVLQREWKKAVHAIVLTYLCLVKIADFSSVKNLPLSKEEAERLLVNYQTRMPNKMNINEIQILRQIVNGNKNYPELFRILPRNRRLFYIHSYQSYLWNWIVQERLTKYPNKLIVGDYIMKRTNNNRTNREMFENIIQIKEENIEKYSITELVYPLPGFRVTYPKNEFGDQLEERLKKDEIVGSANVSDELINNLLNFIGDYRYCFSEVEDFSFEFLELINNEYEHDRSSHYKEMKRTEEKYKAFLSTNADFDFNKFHHLHLEFQLTKSTYATIFLSQLLGEKLNFNRDVQIRLTNDYDPCSNFSND
ncbi:hypothetical protein SNEBB_002420 [Seison nebaliae]|nr:hypothetical protein SNEBB_002420 [Seison nebaliae]